jgi:hypothetical protein
MVALRAASLSITSLTANGGQTRQAPMTENRQRVQRYRFLVVPESSHLPAPPLSRRHSSRCVSRC